MGKDTPKLILASSSPRRAKLLADAHFSFEVRPPNVDERVPRSAQPAKAALEIAARKAAAVDAPGAWVLAADTLIDFEGRALGKPTDEMEAHAMLRMLAGHDHFVITGIAVKPPTGVVVTARALTRVAFRDLTDDEIDAYIRTGDPLDKAGGYGIQGRAKAFVREMEGPLDNVIGLPMDTVRVVLKQTGYPVP